MDGEISRFCGSLNVRRFDRGLFVGASVRHQPRTVLLVDATRK